VALLARRLSGIIAPAIQPIRFGDTQGHLSFCSISAGRARRYLATHLKHSRYPVAGGDCSPGLLFPVEPLDLPAFVAAAAALVTVVAIASYVPARRRSRVDPIIPLRSE